VAARTLMTGAEMPMEKRVGATTGQSAQYGQVTIRHYRILGSRDHSGITFATGSRGLRTLFGNGLIVPGGAAAPRLECHPPSTLHLY
jgi:hypothetical protein